MPLSLNDRNPDLITRVDDAYERARIAQGELVSSVGGVALDMLISDEITQPLVSAEMLIELGETFDRHSQLFERIDVSVPTMQEFIEAGVDLDDIVRKKELFEAENLEPQVIIAPAVNSHGYTLDIERWQELVKVSKLTYRDLPVTLNLHYQNRLEPVWDEINNVPGLALAQSKTAHGLPSDSPRWSIRVIAGTRTATLDSEDNSEYWNELGTDRIPTANEYIVMQSLRLSAGLKPYDIAIPGEEDPYPGTPLFGTGLVDSIDDYGRRYTDPEGTFDTNNCQINIIHANTREMVKVCVRPVASLNHAIIT